MSKPGLMIGPLGKVSTPCGESGDWKVSEFTISEDEAKLENLRALFSGRGIMRVEPGTYKRLTCKGRGVVMSNTPMEVHTNYEAFRLSEGRVLINGLGLGMLLEAILTKKEVKYVRVIELEADVIKLVGPTFKKDNRVEIVQADALTYKPAKGEVFDFAWHDIWDNISSENLPSMATLGRRYNRRVAARQGWWMRDYIRSDERRWG